MTTTYTVYGSDGINAAADEMLFAAEVRLGNARARLADAAGVYYEKEREYQAFLARPAFA